MGQRIIPVAVTAEYIGGDGVTLGAAGSHNSVLIEYDFRSAGPQWDDISGRYVLWTNPQGNSTNRINLGISEKVEGYEGVYQAAPPADAMCVPGWAEMVVVGYTLNGETEVTKIKTEPSRFRVLPGSSRAADNEGVASTVADQLQAEIEAVDDRKVNKPNAPYDKNGTAGQVLETLGDGSTRWRDETVATPEIVDEVLQQHPDWVTTVEDGAISTEKMAKGSMGFILPEQFGAVGDGVTDDADAFEECLLYASTNKVPIMLTSRYYVNRNLTLRSYVRMFGATKNALQPAILVGPDVTLLFNCTGIFGYFYNFMIVGYSLSDPPPGEVYRKFTAFAFSGNVEGDIDSDVSHVNIRYADIGIIVRGKNCGIDACGFTHCRIGVRYDVPYREVEGEPAPLQLRGLAVTRSRFHGIGQEVDMINDLGQHVSWFEDSYGIDVYIHSIHLQSNMIIENNHSDQGTTFFRCVSGVLSNLKLSNNFVETWGGPAIELVGTVSANPSNQGALMISDNFITSKRGRPSLTDPTYFYEPQHLVTITNLNRITFRGNVVKKSAKELIKLDLVTMSSFSNNYVFGAGINSDNTIDSDTCTAIGLDHCQGLQINGNINGRSDDMALVKKIDGGVDSTSILTKNNSNFKNRVITPVSIGTIKASEAISIDLPTEFTMRFVSADFTLLFHCHAYSKSSITQQIQYVDDDIYVLSFGPNADQEPSCYLKKYSRTDPTETPTPLAYTFTVYVQETD